MKEIILTCCKCGREISVSEEGYKSRLKRYNDDEDIKANFTCKVCGVKKKVKV